MLRIHFADDDFSRISINPHPAPLVELKMSLMMLQRPDGQVLFGRCGTWSPPTALRRSSTR